MIKPRKPHTPTKATEDTKATKPGWKTIIIITLHTKNVESVRKKSVLKNVGSVPMKIGWVSRYGTSMIQCPCFFPGSAAGTAALKDMRCKFDVSLYQSWTFEVSVYIKLTLTLNLHF